METLEIIKKAMDNGMKPVMNRETMIAKKCRCGRFGILFKGENGMYVGCIECRKFTKFAGTVYKKKQSKLDIEKVKTLALEKGVALKNNGKCTQAGKCEICGEIGVKTEDSAGNTYMLCWKNDHFHIIEHEEK